MFRRFLVLAFSALMALGGLAAATTPSAAGHRDGVSFGVGIGFDSGYLHFRSGPRYDRHYRHYRPYRHYRYYRDPGPVIYHQPRVRYYQPRVHYRGGGSHVEWCYARYRSYRAYDNTFQPYHGPRKQCWSPYS